MSCIDVVIDEVTNCLVLRETNEEVETEFKKLDSTISKTKANLLKKQGWKFDWSIPQKEGNEVYQLFVKNDPTVQGMIAFKNHPDDYYVYVDLVETAPINYGHTGKYIGVGGHLFAIACLKSFEYGDDGYLVFTPKTKLIKHYSEILNAKMLDEKRMLVETSDAKRLVEKYLKEIGGTYNEKI